MAATCESCGTTGTEEHDDMAICRGAGIPLAGWECSRAVCKRCNADGWDKGPTGWCCPDHQGPAPMPRRDATQLAVKL